MHTLYYRLPDFESLSRGLQSVFGGNGTVGGRTVVLERRMSSYTATFPNEIVTCRMADGSERQLFCKYGGRHPDNVHGEQGGVAYETEVYRHVLQPLGAVRPACYGSYAIGISGCVGLVLEYLAGGVQAQDAPSQPVAMRLTARQIGEFHRLGRAFRPQHDMTIRVYDEDYYLNWARRTACFAGHLHQRYPWLADICRRYERLIDQFVAQPHVVIHGDLYADNALFRDGQIHLVDWGWAALAAGEIDLASLIERRPDDIARACAYEYAQARWPEGPPPDFAQTLDAARLYLQFRWLGNRGERTVDGRNAWRFDQLRATAERLGLV